MTPRFFKHLSLTGLSIGILTVLAGASMASTTSNASPAKQGDLSMWEQRLLGHQYNHDPIDKRVQRLELLLFGGTQDGSLSDRLSDLRSTIASRTTAHVGKSSVGLALKQLEQRVLKKTFAADEVDIRLARLETKLFGKPSPSMSAPDRIDRLKKTIGIGEPPPIAQFPEGNFFGQGSLPDGMGGQIVIPFQNRYSSPGDMNRNMAEMFKQLHEQMRGLNGMNRMPQAPQVTPLPFSEHDFEFKQFRMPSTHKDEELPPYTDPNSI